MAEDHRRVVAEHVDALVAVGVPDPAPFAALDVDRVGVEVGGRSGGAARHDGDGLLVQGTRAGSGFAVQGLRVVWHCR